MKEARLCGSGGWLVIVIDVDIVSLSFAHSFAHSIVVFILREV